MQIKILPIQPVMFALLFIALPGNPVLAVENLPAGFYSRAGLEQMTRVDYAGMKVVNVRECGAAGDGIADERTSFDKAIRALQPEGGIVFIPKGEYYFAPTPLPERRSWNPRVGLKGLNNIHFVGEGNSSRIIFRHPASELKTVFYGWDLSGSSNLSIRDLRFEVQPFLQMRWEPGIGLTPLTFGAFADNVQLVRVSTEQGRMGMVFWGGSKNTWVVDCDVRNTAADGIHFRNGNGVTVAYTYVENSGDDGIALWVAPGKEPVDYSQWGRNYRALYNVVVGTRWGRGIAVSGENVEVIGNWIEESVFAGIGVMDHDGTELPPSNNVLVEDNTILRSGIGVREDNNLIGHNVGAGILIASDIGSVRLVNNRILLGENEGIGLGYPFPLQAERIEIADNTILGNRGVGVRAQPKGVSSIKSLILDGNVIAGNKGGVVTSLPEAIVSSEPADLSSIVEQAGFAIPHDSFAVMRSATAEKDWDLPSEASLEGLPVVNVRDKGAAGDGRTNDLPAFLKALEELASAGGVLRVPEGTYLFEPVPDAERSPDTAVPQHLLIQGAKNIHMVGDPGKSVIRFSSPDHQGIRFLESDACSVRGLTLRGMFDNGSRRNRALLDFAACTNMTVSALEINGSTGPGILLDSCRGVSVKGSRILDSLTEGVRVVSSRQIALEGNVIERANFHGIQVFWSGSICREPQFVRISGNRILDTVLGAGVGVASGYAVEVVGNHIERGGLAGLTVYEHSRFFSPRLVTLSGNTILNSPSNPLSYVQGGIGIFKLYGGRTGETVISVVDNIIDSPGGVGIRVWSNRPSKDQSPFAISRLTIKDNKITAMSGVEVKDSLIEWFLCEGNTLRGGGDLLLIDDNQRKSIKEFVAK